VFTTFIKELPLCAEACSEFEPRLHTDPLTDSGKARTMAVKAGYAPD
jgi:hypothetical protein